MGKIYKEIEDLSFLKWSTIRSSSGTAGSFLKSEAVLNGVKRYFKLSNFDLEKGIVGHECINEIIVDRLLSLLGVDHLSYDLINARIVIEGQEYITYIAASYDFKKRGEAKQAIDDFYRVNCENGESRFEFCIRNGWKQYIEQMLAVDYIIQNRDRHGANIEVLRNRYERSVRIAPLFDHGLSLLFSCLSNEEAIAFDISEEKKCNNFIGGRSCKDNLSYIDDRKSVFPNKLKESDKDFIFADLEGILSDIFIDRIWNMIYSRYCEYEGI